MIYRVIVSARATSDMRFAVNWWRANRSTDQAERWFDLIQLALKSLSRSPERCPLAIEDDLLPLRLRQLHFGVRRKPTHRIVFTVDGSDVVVFRIRHLAQDVLTADDLQ